MKGNFDRTLRMRRRGGADGLNSAEGRYSCLFSYYFWFYMVHGFFAASSRCAAFAAFFLFGLHFFSRLCLGSLHFHPGAQEEGFGADITAQRAKDIRAIELSSIHNSRHTARERSSLLSFVVVFPVTLDSWSSLPPPAARKTEGRPCRYIQQSHQPTNQLPPLPIQPANQLFHETSVVVRT